MQSYKITDVASVKFDSEGPASEVQEVREHARETAVFVTIPAGTRPSVRTIDAIDSTGRAVAELQRDLAKAGVVLALVVVPVKHQADLERMGLIDLIGATRIFDSRHACLAACNLEMSAGSPLAP
jgi:MFS superfamily sulfate permease-like transporter